MSSFAGKVFIITGGTKGIGRAITEKVLAEGATVVVNYNSDKKAADDMVAKLGGSSPGSDNDNTRGRIKAVQADASTIEGVDKIVAGALEVGSGRIDVVIPCAGIMPMMDLEHSTVESYDKVFNLNVKGPLFLVQKSVPYMPATGGGGRVIFISTGVTSLTSVQPPYLLYAATKGAIEQFTRVLAKDLGKKKGITVNCVAPGPTGTDLFYEGKSQETLNMINNLSPFGRVGTPEEIADVVAFLAGEGGRWVSGQVWRVNGGNMV